MRELYSSPFFGLTLTVAAYWLGTTIQKKTKLVICNGMLIAGILIIAILLIFDIPLEAYNAGGGIINMFITPVTVCLGVTIYNNLPLMKKRLLPILAGTVIGAATALFSGLLLCRLVGLDEVMTLSLLPKSVTTPVAVSISEAMGGVGSIAAAAVAITGTTGNLVAPLLCRLFRTKSSVERGLAIGACSHALGTAKALELGEEEGAASGIALGMCALVTSILVLFL